MKHRKASPLKTMSIGVFIKRNAIWFLLLGGLAVRLVAFAQFDFMFRSDVRAFQRWGSQLATYGLSNFYTGEMWSDYPPGYLYILALIGAIRNMFTWDYLSPVFNFFTFLPAILADVAIGYVLYRVTKKEWAAALWLFNPAIILISSVWGQVESVFLLPLVISLVLIRQKKLLAAYLLYGVAILIKPQSLFLGPVYLFSALDYWRDAKFAWGSFGRMAAYAGAAGLGMVLLAFPFAQGFDFIPVLRQFWDGMDMYNYGSVNAYNLWALAGRNWQPLDAIFLGLSHARWGAVIAAGIILTILAALETDKRRTGGQNYWLIVAAVFVFIFVYSVKMHERYLFPAVLFLLLYAAERPRWYSLALFGGISVTFFINCFAVLHAFNGEGPWWDSPVLARWMNPVAWANIALSLCLVAIFFVTIVNKASKKETYVAGS